MPEVTPSLKHTRWAAVLAGAYVFQLSCSFLWSYLPRYFVSVGWTSAAVGTALGIATLLRAFAMPAWARTAETIGRVGIVVRWLATIGTVALWFLPFVTNTVAVYATLIIIYVTWSAYLPLVDAMTIRELGNHAFGRVRAWGSLAFGLAALSVAYFGANETHVTVAGWAPWAIAVLGTLGTICVWSFPRAEVQIRSPALPEAIRLLRRPALYLLLPLWSLHWAAQTPFNLFLVFLCEDRGMAGWVPGVAVAVGITAEVAFLWFGRVVVERLGPERLFALCAAVTTIRWFGTAWIDSEVALIAIQTIHGLSFGGFLLAAMASLDREIRPEVRNSGQAILYVCVFGIGSALGNTISGWIENSQSAAAAFVVAGWVELAVTVGALGVTWWLGRRAR